MAELVLAPTKVYTEGTGSSNAPYVVAPDLSGGTSVIAWTDNDDTSYAKSDVSRSSRGDYPLWSTVDPTIDPSWVTAIGVRFRAKAVTPTYFIVQLFGQVAKLLSNPFYGSVPALSFAASNTWEDFDYVISASEYDTAGWAPLGVQSALTQSFLYVRTRPASDSTGEFGGSTVVYVSEQRVILYYTNPADVALPAATKIRRSAPLVNFPRDDNRGTGTARLNFPDSKAYQDGNRNGGGHR